MSHSKLIKILLNGWLVRYHQNTAIVNNAYVFKQIRFYCTNNTQVNSITNKISIKFSNGFFNFNVNDNHYIISYWTPLRSLLQVMDKTDTKEDVLINAQVIDDRHKVALSPSTPVGFVFSNLKCLTFNHPSLGMCSVEFDGIASELIAWKENFETDLQYGSEGSKKQQTLQEHELSFLEHQREELKQNFSPLLKEYQRIVKLARTDARRKFKWGGLFLLSAQLGFVARLTWFEYSWDIMEPITWMLTYAMMVGTFAYYIVTSQEYLVPSVERRLTISKFWKLAQKQNFDVTKFRSLKDQLKFLDEKILKNKQ